MRRHSKYLFGLELTDLEADAIDKIHAKQQALVKYPQTLSSLVEDWTCLIDEIKSGYGFSMFDYTNDVSSRQVIDSLLPECPPRIQTKLLELLGPLDEQFFELTEVEQPHLPGIEYDQWSRLPKEPKGDLLEFLRTLHNGGR